MSRLARSVPHEPLRQMSRVYAKQFESAVGSRMRACGKWPRDGARAVSGAWLGRAMTRIGMDYAFERHTPSSPPPKRDISVGSLPAFERARPVR